LKAESPDRPLTAAEAASLLEQVELRRERAHADLGASWFPLVLFGGLGVAAALLSLATAPVALAPFWLVAGPLGGVLTARHYMRRERRLGIARAGLPYAAVAVTLIVAASFVGGAGSGLVRELGPALVVAAGYLAFAWLERSLAVAAVALAIGGLAGVLAVARPPAVAELAMLGTGALMLASGLALRSRMEAR
jgi:hypothetical protein